MHPSKIKGTVNELLCQSFFIKLGYIVSVPVCEDCKYDFIADINGKLIRVQAKTCVIGRKGITIHVKSSHLSAKKSITHNYSKEDIDYFCTEYNGKCYLIPIEECDNKECKTLSFEKGRRVTRKIVSFIDDFELEYQLNNINNKIKYTKPCKVTQYDLQGNLLQVFDTPLDAAKFLGKDNAIHHIYNCMNGKRKTAYKYIWKKYDEYK